MGVLVQGGRSEARYSLHGGVRRLSAIMSTDVVAADPPAGSDGGSARRDRDRWRAAVERHTRRKGGGLLRFHGAGALSVFDSAVDAVESALDLQHELLEAPRLLVRTGIHTGDVLYDGGMVHGDAIDVAVQIQRLGEPGSVLASGKVYDEIKNQPHLSAAALGDFRLPSLGWPVRVFALGGEPVPGSKASAPLARSARDTEWSVAVMPFMSASPEHDEFGEGLTVELTSQLARVDGVLVAAHTSALAHRGAGEDSRSLAAGLGVRMLLVGSVRDRGDRVQVGAQLIDAASGDVRFSEWFEGRLEGLFETQEEIARRIVEAVRRCLPPRPAQPADGPGRAPPIQ